MDNVADAHSSGERYRWPVLRARAEIAFAKSGGRGATADHASATGSVQQRQALPDVFDQHDAELLKSFAGTRRRVTGHPDPEALGRLWVR